MDPLDIINASITRDLKHLAASSNNVANVNTPGYLKVDSFDSMINGSAVTITSKVSPIKSGIKATQRALDVAILSSGYFAIEHSNEIFLSRYGRFHVDNEGFMKHVSGGYLLGESGRIFVSDENVIITKDGQVKSANQLVDKLKLVETAEVQRSHLSSLYQPLKDITNVDFREFKTRAINISNVNSAEEMSKMISINRHVQSLQKVASAYDQMLNMGINEMGKR